MNDLAELAPKINAAEAAIVKLPGGRGSRKLKLKIVRSLYASINQARLRGVTYEALAKSIAETTGIRMTGATLKSCIDTLSAETEEMAKKISRNLGPVTTLKST